MSLKPSFKAEPAEVLSISATLPPNPKYAVTELLEDYAISVDDQGRRTHRYRYVFRIDRESAIEGWGVVQSSWSPWFEEKPSIRARVITAAGREDPHGPRHARRVPGREGALGALLGSHGAQGASSRARGRRGGRSRDRVPRAPPLLDERREWHGGAFAGRTRSRSPLRAGGPHEARHRDHDHRSSPREAPAHVVGGPGSIPGGAEKTRYHPSPGSRCSLRSRAPFRRSSTPRPRTGVSWRPSTSPWSRRSSRARARSWSPGSTKPSWVPRTQASSSRGSSRSSTARSAMWRSSSAMAPSCPGSPRRR